MELPLVISVCPPGGVIEQFGLCLQMAALSGHATVLANVCFEGKTGHSAVRL
jgi:hypothetical protein